MIRLLSNHEYRVVSMGLENAKELMDKKMYKQARLELKPGLKILEQSHTITPMLVSYYERMAEISRQLKEDKRFEHYSRLAAACQSQLQNRS